MPNPRHTRSALVAALAIAPLVAQFQLDRAVEKPVFGVHPVDLRIAVDAGDVDGDGWPELALAGPKLLANRRGVWVDVSDLLPAGPRLDTFRLSLADLDGDGDRDLIQLGTGLLGRIARIMLNDGRGGFAEVPASSVPPTAESLIDLDVGDLDGDGDLDLVVVSRSAIRTYRHVGRGVYQDSTAGNVPTHPQPGLVALGDIDGDRDLDVVSSEGFLLRNDGTGRFALDVTSGLVPALGLGYYVDPLLADVDGDGDLDAGFGHRIHVNDGRGRFRAGSGIPAAIAAAGHWATELADCDADGDPDLVMGTSTPIPSVSSSSCIYLPNDGRGGFANATLVEVPDAGYATFFTRSRDLDRDGDVDMLLIDTFRTGPVRLAVQDGKGGFALVGEPRMPLRAAMLDRRSLGDLDGDGVLDWIDTAGAVLLNNGRGTFAIGAGRTAPGRIALGDVDGDGDLDVITNGPPSRLWRNDGKGGFTDVTAGRLVDNEVAAAMRLVDVDGDRDLDLVTATGGQNRVFVNDGTGRFQPRANALPARLDVSTSLDAGDLDGDGDLDLVFGNASTDRVYLNDGTGVFRDAPGSFGVPDVATDDVRLLDVDGDGDLDAYVEIRDTSSIGDRLLVNDGRAGFRDESGRLPAAVAGSRGVAVGDLDTDGDPDVVLIGLAGPSILLNDGRGFFADATPQRIARPVPLLLVRTMLLGDLDGDGDPDLVLSDGTPGPVVFVNRHRQLVVPGIPTPGADYALTVQTEPGYAVADRFALPLLADRAGRTPLGAFGTLRLDPTRLVALPALRIPRREWQGRLAFPIPKSPSLIGATLHAQALVQDSFGGLRFTGASADRIR